MRKALYILGDLIDQDIIFLAEAGQVLELNNGDTLIKAGESVQALYFITNGSMQVRSQDGSKIADLKIGDVVGEMSFVESQPPDANVVAIETSRALAVPKQALLDELQRQPEFAARFYKALATFLSDRLRSMTPSGQAGELDERLLDVMHVAGDRLLRLIDMLEAK